MHIPCFILARKNSKGLKFKNRVNFLGKPLIEHTIEHAKKSKLVTKIVVSTDDYEIAKIAKKNNCIVLYPRSKNYSNDKASSYQAVKEVANYFIKRYGKFDIFGYLQITEPLRPKNILDKNIKKIKNNKKLNSCFAGYIFKNNFWYKNKKKYTLMIPNSETKKPRQKRKDVIREDCGVALASRYNVIFNGDKLLKKPFDIVTYNGVRGLLDIHSKDDIKLGEALVKQFKIKIN